MPKRMPWGEIKDAFTYMGINRYSPSNRWERISAHAGSITENIVQAIARDVLVHWMQNIESAGLKVILHVHDETIVQDKNDVLNQMNQLAEVPIPWAPDLKVSAGGFVTKRYYKD